jgi:deoxyribodipyrimidine photo-lyase
MNKWDKLEFAPRVTRRRAGPVNTDGSCIVYWMQRSQRARDNPALNVAIEAGNLLHKPVVVFFRLVPRSHHANVRHYRFLVEGLADIAAGLRGRNVGFILWRDPDTDFLRFCSMVDPCLIVGDENPMRGPEGAKARLCGSTKLPFWTVDSDVIVPSKLLGRQHYAARTIRPKIYDWLPQFLVPTPNPIARSPWERPRGLHTLKPDVGLLESLALDDSAGAVSSFRGGSREAARLLQRFLKHRLEQYAVDRNHPDRDGTSQLSPYLHFGHIAPLTVALAAREVDLSGPSGRSFLEELIVRRELAINFVRYNSNYDNFASAESWADKSLKRHLVDQRAYLYGERKLENAETHDPLWNAAQKQMVLTGWMHGYLRMYWAKKILEWTSSPAEAYGIAVRLNDRYELDGRDPNGYAGIAWAIVGKHDRAWGPERPVYGNIRYMSYASTSRKFDSAAYIARIEALEKGRSS